MSTYPGSQDGITTIFSPTSINFIDLTTKILPDHINGPVEAIFNIQAALGTNPQGSAPGSTVATRFNNIESIMAQDTYKVFKINSSLIGSVLGTTDLEITASGKDNTIHFQAGNNITLKGDSANKIIQLSAPNSFKQVTLNPSAPGTLTSTGANINLSPGTSGILQFKAGNNITFEHNATSNTVQISAGSPFSNLKVNSTISGTSFLSTNDVFVAPSSGTIHFIAGSNVTLYHDVAKSAIKIDVTNILPTTITTGLSVVNAPVNMSNASLLLPNGTYPSSTSGSVVWNALSKELKIYDATNNPVLINKNDVGFLGGIAASGYMRKDINDSIGVGKRMSFLTGGMILPAAHIGSVIGSVAWDSNLKRLTVIDDTFAQVWINDTNAQTLQNQPLSKFVRKDVSSALDVGIALDVINAALLLPRGLSGNNTPGSTVWNPETRKLYIYDINSVPVLVNSVAPVGGASVLGDLNDVLLGSPSSGQVLKYNGLNWINAADDTGTTISELNDIGNVNAPTPDDGYVLKYNLSTTKWVALPDNEGTSITEINDIGNVNAPSPDDGYVLKYNLSTTKWIASPDNEGTTINAINDIGDVNSPAPNDIDYLKYDLGTGKWVNSNLFIQDPTYAPYGGAGGNISGIGSGDKVEDAFDKIEVILGKLAPAKPVDLSTLTLPLSVYAALEETSGTARSNITSDSTPTSAVSNFYDGDAGTLTAEIDSLVVGTRILGSTDDSGTYGALTITADEDPYPSPPSAGFWKQLDAEITATAPLSLGGPHTYQMKHSDTGNTPLLTFYVDDPATPKVTSQTVSADGGTGLGYISGVPTMEAGDTITVTFNSDNVISEFYNNVRINRAESAYTTDVDEALPGSPPAKDATINASIQVAVEAGKYVVGEDLPITCRAYNSFGTSSTAIATNNIRVDTVSNESSRLKSGTGQFPPFGAGAAQYGTAFVSSTDLNTNEELQLINGSYGYPLGDYTANTPVPGPDYGFPTSTVPLGSHNNMRWITKSLGAYSGTGGTINIIGASGFSSQIESDFELYVQVQGVTGWIDLSAAYLSNPGDPANPVLDGDPALVFGSSDGDTKVFTFGSTVRAGTLYVRAGIQHGSSKQFSNLTLS